MILTEGTNAILQILQYIACAITALTGFFALFAPERALVFTGLNAKGGRGLTEVRCIFGGLFIALGISPFLLGEVAFTVLGIGYLTIGVVRLISIFIDRSANSSNWGSFALEILFGVILVL